MLTGFIEILARNPRKSTGIDDIPVTVLQAVAATISQSLAILINRCLHEGKFPEQWKHAICRSDRSRRFGVRLATLGTLRSSEICSFLGIIIISVEKNESRLEKV